MPPTPVCHREVAEKCRAYGKTLDVVLAIEPIRRLFNSVHFTRTGNILKRPPWHQKSIVAFRGLAPDEARQVCFDCPIP